MCELINKSNYMYIHIYDTHTLLFSFFYRQQYFSVLLFIAGGP